MRKKYEWFKSIVLILLSVSALTTFAQPYTDSVYRHEIKSVEFYNSTKKASFPLINLNSGETVTLGFDNLAGGTLNYHYTIEHCDAEWNPSNISTAEYLKNYNDDRILNYSYSIATVQKYTHYELTLPNENIAPKIPGNYILKVYDDSDPTKLVLTRKLYVLGPKINIAAEIVPSSDNATRQTNQKVNFTLDYGSLRVQNPNRDVRTLLMQNNRVETAIMNNQPTYIRGTQLIYSDVNINNFAAGNEFRHFDTRTLKLNSQNILHIYRDTANTVMMLTDPDRNKANYTLEYDLDGNYYILNQDGTDPRIDADYAHMIFSLSTARQPNTGTPYIVGRFNDYKLDENSKMTFNTTDNKYFNTLFLKQGVYDYTFVWVDKNGKADNNALEGSYFETENDYQVLVYYRPAGARWEELVGFRLLNSTKK
ncbi:type IX secretion system plug protein [Mucilaginibacter xinganensis]|uniref:DUF5103 domain-containing protein n=1 Tax=Mucilaginibacter xinganensis TaxID=1234841 RepID=A0A223NVJ6_9SPHI|nr:DUF5103 domain-containing protein [Mucilaginibacter xinganensis]ASU33694.1 DUF5103 domain-containing protein [Mucilaginibacter xinganensis]